MGRPGLRVLPRLTQTPPSGLQAAQHPASCGVRPARTPPRGVGRANAKAAPRGREGTLSDPPCKPPQDRPLQAAPARCAKAPPCACGTAAEGRVAAAPDRVACGCGRKGLAPAAGLWARAASQPDAGTTRAAPAQKAFLPDSAALRPAKAKRTAGRACPGSGRLRRRCFFRDCHEPSSSSSF